MNDSDKIPPPKVTASSISNKDRQYQHHITNTNKSNNNNNNNNNNNKPLPIKKTFSGKIFPLIVMILIALKGHHFMTVLQH